MLEANIPEAMPAMEVKTRPITAQVLQGFEEAGLDKSRPHVVAKALKLHPVLLQTDPGRHGDRQEAHSEKQGGCCQGSGRPHPCALQQRSLTGKVT